MTAVATTHFLKQLILQQLIANKIEYIDKETFFPVH